MGQGDRDMAEHCAEYQRQIGVLRDEGPEELSDQQAAAMVLSAYRRWEPDVASDSRSLMLQLEQALIRCGYVLFDGDLTEAGKALLREHG